MPAAVSTNGLEGMYVEAVALLSHRSSLVLKLRLRPPLHVYESTLWLRNIRVLLWKHGAIIHCYAIVRSSPVEALIYYYYGIVKEQVMLPLTLAC